MYGEVSVSVSPPVAPKAHKLKMQQDRPINGRLHIIEATTVLNVNEYPPKKAPRPWEIRWYYATQHVAPMKGHEPPKTI